MNSSISLIREIDALLPQTQCGLCGHRDGCLPYAKSIAEGEEANKCVPGGQPVADALANLLNRPVLTAETSVWPVQADGRPQRMKAIIREDECIGCTKCISACPVDAIIGSGKLMHTILTDLCTGCELCIPPCPVDCIDLVEDTQALPNEQQRIAEQNDLRQRYYAHIQREEKRRTYRKGPVVRAEIDTQLFAQFSQVLDEVPSIELIEKPKEVVSTDAKTTIELAKIRTQIKKLEKQLSVREDAKKRLQLEELQQQLMQLQEV
ncbi:MULTISPECIES: RnfABCDGE type electron transport complex subunit B [Acinetobacter]|jgi:electron transport complex protein RnfB|uniref:RnfABCDGE type electron transport complex subunit B n=1 Tax=Acinetobacter pittii TaxID=48296 RepID=A0AAE9M6B5_ACIPI|nr:MULTISPECIES: RnfABCDGE type electron transport complex subunit B [Acinetobacter calcoaceticus/baumannii complex]AZP30230.1 RnfABCDGE type electron transport complex subunit B [Acinetobacter pittii]EXE26638.1 electron transport complex, RnfABCDGE type, B subunit [Acinetobacter sp. 907131]EXE62242.1 electron transport complex, RnfABCDGE type, B subunit [Acinetobacter sp. 1542444]EXS16420.1 electron transport complex, RnfABCDGE type, B subunit [Acinetobacter sp. 883425]MBK0409980.1 RnfABCDGE 